MNDTAADRNQAGEGASGEAADEALRAGGIHKQYGGIHALVAADLVVRRAEVHALLGENGAGKSTLVKIVAGVVRQDAGEIFVDGQPLNPGSPQDSRDAGIATVYQELSLVPELSVTHNLVLADMPLRGGLISFRKARKIAEEALAKLGLEHIDPRSPVAHLPLDQRQMVEITKASMRRPRILILDEATSSLGSAEVERLFELVRGLRDQGTTVVVITHRMGEVWALADSMTILRDGRSIGRYDIGEIDQRRAVSLMAGRDITAAFPDKATSESSPTALEVRDVQLNPRHAPWTLEVRRGEILGLGGLQGQGQREFLHWLYGAGPGHGTVVRDGRPVRIRKPANALRHGIVLIPEDRALEGLHLNLPVRWNLAMATLGLRSRLGVIQMGSEKKFAAASVEAMAVKTSSPFQPVSALSGGTQQKVVIGKFMATHPAVLLFVDSTRGIDVQTKFEFYDMLRGLAREGATCVLYSSDTEELVGLCDRVAVFHDGVPALMLEGDDVTQDAVVAGAFAVARESA
jgi:ribose transport system ATP-binding protein